MTESTQMQVYVRHWHPSSYTVDLTREVILCDTSPQHLRAKVCGQCVCVVCVMCALCVCVCVQISELSGIPVENVDFAKVSTHPHTLTPSHSRPHSRMGRSRVRCLC